MQWMNHYSSGWHTIKDFRETSHIFLFTAKYRGAANTFSPPDVCSLTNRRYFCSKPLTHWRQRAHPAERCINTLLCTLCFTFSLHWIEFHWRLTKEGTLRAPLSLLVLKDRSECLSEQISYSKTFQNIYKGWHEVAFDFRSTLSRYGSVIKGDLTT